MLAVWLLVWLLENHVEVLIGVPGVIAAIVGGSDQSPVIPVTVRDIVGLYVELARVAARVDHEEPRWNVVPVRLEEVVRQRAPALKTVPATRVNDFIAIIN